MFHAITPHVAWLKNLSRYSIALISNVWETLIFITTRLNNDTYSEIIAPSSTFNQNKLLQSIMFHLNV